MAEVDVNTLDTNDLIIALRARQADLSPEQRKSLSEIATADETRGDVSATIKGRRTAPLSAAEDANTAPDRFARLKQTLTAQYAAWAQGVDGNKPTLEQALTSFSPEQLVA